MSINLYGDVQPRTAALASKRFLKNAQAEMAVERVMQVDPMQKGKTASVTWRRYDTFASAVAPLDEAVPPDGKPITYTDVTANLELFGELVEVTRKITDHHEDPVINETVDNLSIQAAETIETNGSS